MSLEKLLRRLCSDIPIMGTTVGPGGSVFYNESATVTVKEVRALYLNIPPPVRCVHFRIDPFTIMIEFTPRRMDQVILVCDLVKEISDTIQDITITEWQSCLAILNLSLKPFQIGTIRVQQPEVILERMHRPIAD